MEGTDIKSQVKRLRMQGLHCGYSEGNTDASVNTHLPEFMKNMSLVSINKMVDELALVCITGELDTAQKDMYWFLKDNGIIGTLREVNVNFEEE